MTKAERILAELKFNSAFVDSGNPKREKEVAEALVNGGANLTAARAKTLIRGLAKHKPGILVHAVARGLPDTMHNQIRQGFGAPDTLRDGFFMEGINHGVAQEAAKLLMDLGRCAHVPGVIKHLSKRAESSADLVACAQGVFEGPVDEDWNDEIRLLAGLLGVLARSGDGVSLAVIERVRVGLAEYDDQDEVHDTNWLVERLVKSLGKRPAKGVGARAKRASMARRSGTEAVRLAKSLNLSLAEKPKWRVSIWLAKGEPNPWFGAMQKGPQVHLKLSSEQKPDWKLDVRGDKSGIYSNWAGRVTQDDFGLPALGSLEEFPRWLPEVGKTLKMRFSIEQASVDCGRFRASVAPLLRWLESASS